jgi:hypothetical protein
MLMKAPLEFVISVMTMSQRLFLEQHPLLTANPSSWEGHSEDIPPLVDAIPASRLALPQFCITFTPLLAFCSRIKKGYA